MDLDRQTIEKKDFPFARRGYDAAAVDAHLAQIASDIEALKRSHAQDSRKGESLASAAAAQVQAIVEAAETTASDIKRDAEVEARRLNQDAEREADRTRAEAVQRAQNHTESVSKASAVMLQRVDAMQGEVNALIETIRTGANRLTADLSLLEGNMGDLYDAAGRKRGGGVEAAPMADDEPARTDWDAGEGVRDVRPARRSGPSSVAALPPDDEDEETIEPEAEAEPALSVVPSPPAEDEHEELDASEASSVTTDLEGARLIALNMALNGQPREEADRYLAENFDIPDRASLLDEVYSAVDG